MPQQLDGAHTRQQSPGLVDAAEIPQQLIEQLDGAKLIALAAVPERRGLFLTKHADLHTDEQPVGQLRVNIRRFHAFELPKHIDLFVREKEPREVFQLKPEGVVPDVEIHVRVSSSED